MQRKGDSGNRLRVNHNNNNNNNNNNKNNNSPLGVGPPSAGGTPGPTWIRPPKYHDHAMTIPKPTDITKSMVQNAKESVGFYSGIIYILDDLRCGSCISYILGTHSIILKLWEKIASFPLTLLSLTWRIAAISKLGIVQKTDHTVTHCD